MSIFVGHPSPAFQSTLPCGSDSWNRMRKEKKLAFQSTLPCGSDFGQDAKNPKAEHFNPRSLAGATMLLQLSHPYQEFQSTLPCGSDITNKLLLVVFVISIHAPLRERPFLT